MNALLSIKGNKILKNGSLIRLRGVSFGTWMLIEHFMIGLLDMERHGLREHGFPGARRGYE